MGCKIQLSQLSEFCGFICIFDVFGARMKETETPACRMKETEDTMIQDGGNPSHPGGRSKEGPADYLINELFDELANQLFQ